MTAVVSLYYGVVGPGCCLCTGEGVIDLIDVHLHDRDIILKQKEKKHEKLKQNHKPVVKDD